VEPRGIEPVSEKFLVDLSQIDFYVALGAIGMDGWTVHRLAGAPLAALATEAPPPASP